MNRSLAIVSAVVLLGGQPALGLAHPAGVALPRVPVSAPHVPAHEGSTTPEGFRVPPAPEVQLKPLPQSQRFALPARFYPQTLPSLHRWYGWQWTPPYLLYSAFYGTQCYATNNLASSSYSQEPFGVTLSSLVDGKANLLSPSTYNRSLFVAQDNSSTNDASQAFSFGFRTRCSF